MRRDNLTTARGASSPQNMCSKSVSPSSAPAPMLRVAEIEGKGRSLVASAALRAGEIVLRDSPLLLYSAFPFFPTSEPHLQPYNVYCSNCFRLIISQPPPSSCPACSDAFCTSGCRSVALSSSHSPWICQAMRRLRDASYSPLVNQTLDRQVMARFLVAAYNLAAISPPDFRILLSLQGDPSAVSGDDAAFLHSLVSSLSPPTAPEFGLSVDLTASLLAKDKLNGFGLMEPFHPDKDRSVRAYGIYPRASFFNHDCLPNACRFDYVDADANSRTNTDFIVRLLHDVPEGREICLSYFPVNLKYSERQQRLKEDYGFACDCDRCKVEANWDDDEGEQEGEMSGSDSAMSGGEEEAMEEDGDEEMEADNGEFPHAYFFLRFMCSRDNCWGTLAPLPPSNASPSTLMECNVCGNVNSIEEPMDDGSGNQ
nr:histone-lysine N-methyltransferase ASHR2 [Ipomoea batatas]